MGLANYRIEIVATDRVKRNNFDKIVFFFNYSVRVFQYRYLTGIVPEQRYKIGTEG